MESIVQFSTIENPMNCKVFKVNLIEKLIEKLKLANSTTTFITFFNEFILSGRLRFWDLLPNYSSDIK
jgi:hypothetical protein